MFFFYLICGIILLGDFMAKATDVVYMNEDLNVQFNFRVAGIIVDGNNYLIQHSGDDPYYSLVGGRVELSEDTATSLIREIEEEVNIKVNLDDLKLIDVVENFFYLKGRDFHELLFIYRVDVSKYNLDKEPINTLDKKDSVNTWFSYNEMLDLNIQPKLIKDILNSTELNHTINRD